MLLYAIINTFKKNSEVQNTKSYPYYHVFYFITEDNMTYNNPILPGFHPDPSICRVGEDYYLINSSFEYFPSIPVFHSKDLIHWEQYGHCIAERDKLALRKGCPNLTGIYASTIRYHKGTFYVVSTNVAYGEKDEGNFFVHTKDPKTGWSDPIHLDTPGIDPSFFFDEDDRTYYTGAFNGKIFMQEIDISTGASIGELEYIWDGTGGNDPEGPHIYKKDGWYYLLISEGGTEHCHMITMAKSRNIHGPYDSYEKNPVLTNRSHGTVLKAIGHADLVQDQNDNWWVVCLGIRPISYPYRHNLGRETMLAPVVWNKNSWPEFANNGILEETIETANLPLSTTSFCPDSMQLAGTDTYYDDFSLAKLNDSWNCIYNPAYDFYTLHTIQSSTGLTLHGNQHTIDTTESIAWLGRRQEHHNVTVCTKLTFTPDSEGDEAGLTIYLNNRHHYEIALAKYQGKKCIILRRQIGSLYKVEKTVEYTNNVVYFKLTATKESYEFAYSEDGSDYITLGGGETSYLTTEVGGYFTGNYIAMYATEKDTQQSGGATFAYYDYQATT